MLIIYINSHIILEVLANASKIKKEVANEHIYQTETDSQTQRTDLWLPSGRRGGRGKDWEFGINRCKLLYTGWINNKVLLYSTGKYIQYPVIKHNGKGYEKECIHV